MPQKRKAQRAALNREAAKRALQLPVIKQDDQNREPEDPARLFDTERDSDSDNIFMRFLLEFINN